jgi:hypothetical protein
MKRLLTIFIFILSLNIVTFSQDFAKRGTWELGGSIGFMSSTGVSAGQTDPAATSTFSFSPEAGYFITDNFELALLPFSIGTKSTPNFHYNIQNNQIVITTTTTTTTSFNFLIAPTWNFDMQSNIYPYIQALIGYGTISEKDNIPNGYDYTVSGLDYGAGAGVKLQVARSSILNLGVSYLMTNREQSGESSRFGDNIFQIMAGFSVFIR